MSKKRTTFSAEFKTKIVLEALKDDKALNEIASANNITPKNIQNWKSTFLANAEMAMEPSRAVQEYKDELKAKNEEIDQLQKALGKTTLERDWLQGKQHTPQKRKRFRGPRVEPLLIK